MALIIVSLILFLAMVVAWIALPSGAMIAPAQESSEPLIVAPGQTA
jgi:hypothetical protein